MKIKSTRRHINLVRPESKQHPGHILARYGDTDIPFLVALEKITFETEQEKTEATTQPQF